MGKLYTLFFVISFLISSCLTATYNVLVILPYKKPSGFKFPFGAELSGAAVSLANEDIVLSGLLGTSTLDIDYKDSHCNVVYSLGNAADALYSKTYHIIIGPQCSQSCSHVARLAAYKNIPDFTGVCQDTEMLDKTQFKTLTRFLGTFTMVGKAVVGFMAHKGWDRLGIIAETHVDKIWLLSQEGVATESALAGYNVAKSIAIGSPAYASATKEQILDEVANASRIIVLAVRGNTLRELMLYAHSKGYMDGRYFFICLYYYEQPNVFGDFSFIRNDANDAVALEAYHHVVFIQYYTRQSPELTAFDTRMRAAALTLFNHTFQPTDSVPYPAANLYEAMYMYARALKETLDDGEDPLNGTRVSQRLWGREFNDSLTGNLKFNANGDREQAYTFSQVSHLHNSSIATWDLSIIGYFFSATNSYVEDQTTTIIWPSGSKPSDTPSCGYSNEFCPTMSEKDKILVGIGGAFGCLVLIMIGMIFGFWYYKRWMKKKQSEIMWRVYFSDILFSRGSATSMSKLSVKSGGSSGGGQIFTKTGTYKGAMVAIKVFQDLPPTEAISEHNKKEYFEMTELNSKNVTQIIGVCVDAPNFLVLTEYCAKGSLQDILENDSINLDLAFKKSLMQDLIKGLAYIHDSSLKYHGNLKSSNCVVDGRFTMKVTDFGPRKWLETKERDPKDLLWSAPEVLRGNTLTSSQWQKADIYSMAIIINEITMRLGTFHVEDGDYTADEMLEKIRKGQDPPFRPHIHVDENNGCTNTMQRLMTHSWDEDPHCRLNMKQVKQELKEIIGPGAKSFMDSLLERMEQYANNLEGIVEERTGKYMAEKKKVEELLHTILPPSIADQLQSQGSVEPETFDLVTILFTDIKGFTALSSSSTPIEIVNFLNDLYVCFDSIIDEFDAYKVETIGDAYMVVSGLPKRNDDHFCQIAELTLALMVAVKTFKIRHRPDMPLLLRAGMHTGSCVAGVVGLKMPRYCLFGDTVNTASRMESNGEALKIHVSGPCRDNLVAYPGKNYDLEVRGTIPIKGKGEMTTYWLLGKDGYSPMAKEQEKPAEKPAEKPEEKPEEKPAE
ncbi:atrial natriuretic peptide receptor 1-like [Liolophura sinensis]|uniref:atrial natriuretic peptide receptor 1-like n=1 Tax=Liolophura sinensis TaxID=3198878 RepID=UPI00315935EB